MKQEKDAAILNVYEVTLPVASFGTCKYWNRCRNFQVILGNGLCLECYDKGLDMKAIQKGY